MIKTGAIKKLLLHLPAWILLLQMVNLSVDLSGIQHTQQRHISSTTVNNHEIETLYELIAEKFCEQTLPDTPDEGIDKDLHFFDIVCQRLPDTDLFMLPESPNRAAANDDGIIYYYPRLLSPPPDHA